MKKEKKLKKYFVDISSLIIYAENADQAWDIAMEMYQDGTALLDEIELNSVSEW
tara:strand:- start:2530 stop:2691 length:162 start_codon:yes stop_codon:yes gene_type:complete